jgi:hypothetical protein
MIKLIYCYGGGSNVCYTNFFLIVNQSVSRVESELKKLRGNSAFEEKVDIS